MTSLSLRRRPSSSSHGFGARAPDPAPDVDRRTEVSVQKDGFARVESHRRITRSMRSRDPADRDAITSSLIGYRDQNGQDWADIVDFLTMWPDARRRVVRVLAEIDAS